MTKLAVPHGDLGLCWLSGAKLRDLELQDWKNSGLPGSYPLNNAEIYRWEVTYSRSHGWMVTELEPRVPNSKSPVLSGTK